LTAPRQQVVHGRHRDALANAHARARRQQHGEPHLRREGRRHGGLCATAIVSVNEPDEELLAMKGFRDQNLGKSLATAAASVSEADKGTVTMVGVFQSILDSDM